MSFNPPLIKIYPDGFALVELLISLAVGSIIILSLSNITVSALASWDHAREKNRLLYESGLAMERMVNAIRNTRRLMVPLTDINSTLFDESVNSALAVTIDPEADRNSDGFLDGDNDQDGLVDEDIPADNTNDGASGIIGIDDNNNGTVDTLSINNNDEDTLGNTGEDWIDGKDNDNDNSIDEDIPGGNTFNSGAGAFDNDGDGSQNEDWLDPVVYFAGPAGRTLIERMPDLNPIDGNDFTERAIIEAETVIFTASRLPPSGGARGVLVLLSLSVTGPLGETVTLNTKVRVGGSQE